MISDPDVLSVVYLVAFVGVGRALRFRSSPRHARRGTWVWYRLQPEAVRRFGRIAGSLAPAPDGAAVATDDRWRRLPILQPR